MILYIHKDRMDEIDENEIAKTFIGKMREEGTTLERFEKNVLHYVQLISIFLLYKMITNEKINSSRCTAYMHVSN